MKFAIASLFMMLALACAPPNLPPASAAIATADAVVLRLGELGDTAIALNHGKALGDTPELAIVHFVQDGVRSAKAGAAGWQDLLKVAWAQIVKLYGPGFSAIFGVVWDRVNGLLGGVL